MERNVATRVLGVAMLAALGGCAYQDPLQLPGLGPQAQSSPSSPYYGQNYGPYYGYGFSYGYGSGYRPGYDPYYNSFYHGGADPRYYGPGVVYVPYPRYVPVPCADANGDGRCDKRRRGDGHGGHGDDGGRDDPPDGKYDGVPQWPNARDGGGPHGDGPRVRQNGGADRYVAPGTSPRVTPAPVVRPPAPAPRTSAVPPAPRPAETRRSAAPPADRPSRAAPPTRPPVPEDGAPPRRPD